jgi:hypothetical protein
MNCGDSGQLLPVVRDFSKQPHEIPAADFENINWSITALQQGCQGKFFVRRNRRAAAQAEEVSCDPEANRVLK